MQGVKFAILSPLYTGWVSLDKPHLTILGEVSWVF